MQNLSVQRHELKYFISRADYERFRILLSECMQRDEFQTNSDGYLVRSLYLDDLKNSSVEEKLAGIEFRDKYRFRIYDPAQDWAKLERKRKVNQYVNKESCRVTKKEVQEIINHNYTSLLNSNNPKKRMLGIELSSHCLRPVTMIDYKRDAFVLDFNNIRITFDKLSR